MPKYRVEYRGPWDFEVEADSEFEAEYKAIEEAERWNHFRAHEIEEEPNA